MCYNTFNSANTHNARGEKKNEKDSNTIEVLFNIADALNVEVKDLLDDDNWDFMNQNV